MGFMKSHCACQWKTQPQQRSHINSSFRRRRGVKFPYTSISLPFYNGCFQTYTSKSFWPFASAWAVCYSVHCWSALYVSKCSIALSPLECTFHWQLGPIGLGCKGRKIAPFGKEENKQSQFTQRQRVESRMGCLPLGRNPFIMEGCGVSESKLFEYLGKAGYTKFQSGSNTTYVESILTGQKHSGQTDKEVALSPHQAICGAGLQPTQPR